MLRFNGTEIPTTGTIRYAGTSLTKVNFNGVTVWEKEASGALCFTANTAGSTITLNCNGSSSTLITSMKYSSDSTNWNDYSFGSAITLTNVGDKVYFKGEYKQNPSGSNYLYFTMTGSIAASGNIMSLCSGDDFESVTSVGEFYFYNMFYNCTSLTTAPELPATTLATFCYNCMFLGCTSLTTAPELPATTLADCCYECMFSNCTSLTTAPSLPATILVGCCYHIMFSNCTSLTTAPELPATTLASQCYQDMFSDCTSLTTAPELPATTLANQCYRAMFYNCTSLTSAPELPATTLASSCYEGMFCNCTSLTTAPSLPATILVDNCYGSNSTWGGMFWGCTSLYVSDTPISGTAEQGWKIPTSNIASGNYTMTNMFRNCLGTRSTNSPNFNGIQKIYYTQNKPV